MTLASDEETGEDRVERFKADVRDMRLREPAVKRDRALLVFGIVLMVVGVVVAIYGYALSHAATNDQRQQLDGITIGLIGVAVSVVGAALFLRYSLAQFLRFWLARFVYEQQAQTDRVVEAIKPPASAD